MSIKLKKVREAIYNNPELIPILLKDTSIPKGMIYRELRKAVPCRIGIEFELSGDFIGEFRKKYGVKEYSDKYVTNFYKVKEISCDDTCYETEQVSLAIERITDALSNIDHIVIPTKVVDYEKLVEIRVSISDFHQLKGLYRFMQDVSEFCRLHEGGGIHIHVDMSQYFKTECKKMEEVAKYLTKHLNEIASIFPKYTGKYNKRKIGIRRKATYLNISRLNTFEFRIAPLTFDYFTLMTWVRDCIKFRNKVICECGLKALDKKKDDKEYKVYELEPDACCVPNRFQVTTNRVATDTGLTGLSDYESDSGYVTVSTIRTAATNEVWS